MTEPIRSRSWQNQKFEVNSTNDSRTFEEIIKEWSDKLDELAKRKEAKAKTESDNGNE